MNTRTIEVAGREFAMLTVRSREWTFAWRGLVALTGDRDRMAMCPMSGEVWQYMGSERIRRRWEHAFRHRNHPSSNERLLVWVPSSKGWKPADEKRQRRTLH